MKNSIFSKLKRFIKTACLYVGAALLLAGCVDIYSFIPDFTAVFGPDDKLLTVSYLDVGQADSTLISLPDGKYVLIDGGNIADGELIAQYLQNRGIETIDLLVATHPHEDHIGGLEDVLAAVDVLQVYMPELSRSDTPTTKVYEGFLDAVMNEGCDVYPAMAGETVMQGDDYSITCLSPARTDIGDLNNYSVVLKLSYKDAEFLFMGDAEAEMEEEILDAGYDVSADVLKMGHHGSNTSSCSDFLLAASPHYGVISCGTDNKYGHPHKETLESCSEYFIGVYRTDTDGTIHIATNGVDFSTQFDKNLSLDGNK